jgi:ABC-type nitrate/sulfonate/bicarbonate transport system substrate-binding protein
MFDRSFATAHGLRGTTVTRFSWRRVPSRGVLGSLCFCAVALGCDPDAPRAEGDLIPLSVELGSRSVSKLPFVIAADQGLYEKHGLAVRLWMPEPDFRGGWEPSTERPRRPDISVDGGTPMMVDMVTKATAFTRVMLASTDCVVRAHIVARPEIETLEDLKGKRLGISSGTHTTTGFVALRLAERMGWDPVQDISIMLGGRTMRALRDGRVDAIVASERRLAQARREGFPSLVDTRTWDLPVAGNSVRVEPGWLETEANRDAARRFLQATIEGIALFHADRELALEVLEEWHGVTDAAYAATFYDGGRWIPREPYPCYDGIDATLELYDSNEMRKHVAGDFYDDSLMREIDESGFIDSVYAAVAER